VQLLGTDYTLVPGTASGLGFAGISVALLGRATAGGTVAASLLYGALEAGGLQMQAATAVPVDIVTVIQALIVLFIAAPRLVGGAFGLRGAKDAGLPVTARGW
jgi:simple sugar transport system permease protein